MTGARRPPGLWAVVPVKRFADSKRRLMPLLDVHEREALAGAMLHDVLSVLVRTRSLAGTIVVTGERGAAAAARALGAIVEADDGDAGLNAAVMRAARRLAGEGRDGMLVLPADVPLITVSDVDAIVRAHCAAPAVTLVPAGSDGGTNALACSAPLAIASRFGEDSLRGHQRAAQAAGIAATVLSLPRVEHDLDHPDDLARFLLRPSSTRCRAYLVASGIARRLRVAGRDPGTRPVAEEASP